MQTNLQTVFQTLSPEKQALVLKKLQAQPNLPAQTTEEPPLRVVNRERPLPLSLNQEQLWFLAQLEGQSSAYHTFSPIECKGLLHIPTLEKVFTELFRRHESLRTTFAIQNEQPVQIIHPPSPIQLPVIDISQLAADERLAEAKRLTSVEAQQPFDLTSGPLCRVRVLRLAMDWHILLINLHHIITDGWSLSILYRELSLLYEAYLVGRPSPLPALALQYADFAVWQRQWLQGEKVTKHLDYWRKQLADLPPLLELPTDAPRPAIQSTAGDIMERTLPAHLTSALNRLSQQCGVTLFMTLLAAFNLLLARYSNQQEIAIGAPIANRTHRELEPLMGFFANTLVLRTDLSGDPTFTELLARVQRMTHAAYEHGTEPFGEIVKALHPQRTLSHHPLFQVMFAFHNFSLALTSPPGLTLAPFVYHQNTAMFDLSLEFLEQDGELRSRLEYNTDLFQAATITRMLDHLSELLTEIVAKPEQRLSQFTFLTADDRQQLLTAWQGQRVSYDQTACIHQLIEEQARLTPTASAVVSFGKSETLSASERVVLTYGDLDAKATQLAAYLQSCGIGPEKIVAICLERTDEMLIALLGVLKAGGAYVALDPEYPSERLAWILADTQAPLLLTQTGLRERFAECNTPLLALDTDWPIISACRHPLQASGVTSDTLAYLIYTSGSTGLPKGVMGTHRNLLNAFQIAQNTFGLQRSDKVLQMANFAFSVFAADWVRALCAGATLVICPRLWLLQPEKLYALLQSEAITFGDFVPAVFRQLAHYLQTEQQQLPLLRLLIIGSDSWHLREYAEFRRLCGAQTRLLNGYGTTETTVDSCCFEPTVADLLRSDLMPIGRPLGNVLIYILDSAGQLAPIGVPGELYIGGDSIARGYLNQPTLTQEKFIPNPFGRGRLYKTGDRARYRVDGVIEFLGRVDNQVKLRGFRVELGEIEATLLQHPQVKEALVIVSEDQTGEKWLTAYIVPLAHGAVAAADGQSYRGFLQTRLPSYMVPAAFMVLESLPLTLNGKVDRKALPKVTLSTLAESAEWVAPRTQAETSMADHWAEVLGIERVSVHANFFEIGGHSLLAVRLMQRLQQQVGVPLPLSALFQYPTIAQLTVALQQPHTALAWSPLVAIQSHGDRRPFFCVHGVGGGVTNYYSLARALDPAQPFYGLQARGLDGQVEPYMSLKEMVNAYVTALQTVQPHGPYVLGGHSFGGTIAFAMAQRLLAQDETVARLILLDSYAPGSLPNESATWDNTDWLLAVVEQLELGTGQSFEIALADFRTRSFAEQLAWVSKRMQLLSAPATAPIADFVGHSDGTDLRGLVQVFKANHQMAYYPNGPLPIPITLLRAREGWAAADGLKLDTTLGWQGWASTPVQVLATDGDHFTMLAEPHVQRLADQLMSILGSH